MSTKLDINDLKYNFFFYYRSPSCRSVIEIIDVNPNGHKKSLFKVCSPTSRKARNDLGAFIPPQTFVSSSNQIIVVLRRSSPPHELNDIEVKLFNRKLNFFLRSTKIQTFSLLKLSNFVCRRESLLWFLNCFNLFVSFKKFIDGAFMFHNEEQSGTLQPYSLCDTHHYGLSSPEMGSLDGPVRIFVIKLNGKLYSKLFPGKRTFVLEHRRKFELFTLLYSGRKPKCHCDD